MSQGTFLAVNKIIMMMVMMMMMMRMVMVMVMVMMMRTITITITMTIIIIIIIIITPWRQKDPKHQRNEQNNMKRVHGRQREATGDNGSGGDGFGPADKHSLGLRNIIEDP